MKTFLKGALCAATLLPLHAATAGPDALLGLQLDYPRIEYQSVGSAQGASYDGSTLSISSTPVFTTFTSGGTTEFTLNGSLTLSAQIDAAGQISGGSFSVSGDVTDTATGTSYTGVLLSGSVVDYGISDLGNNDLADFRLLATGGSMKALFDSVSGEVAASMTLEGDSVSSYPGSFAAPWSALRAKGSIGPIPVIEPIDPHTIGYWKNHPEAWPVSSLTICGDLLSQSHLIDVLKSPSRKDKTLIMAKQLIAAMLNEAGGNACPTIVDAENWLCTHGGIGASRRDWDGGEALKDALDTFNNGGSCS